MPATLSAIVQMAMEPNRDDRCPDARTLQRALDEWLVSTQARVSTPELAELVDKVSKARPSIVHPSGEGSRGTPISSNPRAMATNVNADERLPVIVGVLEEKKRRRAPKVLLAVMMVLLLATIAAIGWMVLQPSWLPAPPTWP